MNVIGLPADDLISHSLVESFGFLMCVRLKSCSNVELSHGFLYEQLIPIIEIKISYKINSSICSKNTLH
jgi:hypothetical protein